MDSRLAHIIADSIGPDGKPDRAKIYQALALTPTSPEAILIDAALHAEGSAARIERALAAHMAVLQERPKAPAASPSAGLLEGIADKTLVSLHQSAIELQKTAALLFDLRGRVLWFGFVAGGLAGLVAGGVIGWGIHILAMRAGVSH